MGFCDLDAGGGGVFPRNHRQTGIWVPNIMFPMFGTVKTLFTLFLDLVTGCDQLVTAGHTFILLLKSQGTLPESFIKIG